ncbi:MAG: S8 family serine peptidase [Proteobacteria bacterium]|nr:S8 family serine peptidase [Pseudomonadota bacterium]
MHAVFVGIVLSCLWGVAPLYAASDMEKSAARLVKEKKGQSLGQDWYALLTLSQDYPKSLSTSYTQALQQIADFERLKAHTAAKVAPSPEYKKAKGRRDFAAKQLRFFRRSLNDWVGRVRTKITYGLYTDHRREFYRDLLKAFDLYVLKEKDTKALVNVHFYVETMTPPSNEGASFEERFLKPKYAAEYQARKVKFYEDFLALLHKARAPLLADAAANKEGLASLEADIAKTKAKIAKWQAKTAAPATRAQFTLDQVMGIEAVKEMGYTGKGVLLGVLEPPPFYETTAERKAGVHQDIKKRLHAASSAPAALHGSHVAGIVVSRAKTIFDRAGVAPKATLLYKEVPSDDRGVIYYQGPKGLVTKEPAGTTRTLVTSVPSAAWDTLFAGRIEDMMTAGVRLINTSMVYSVGPKTRASLAKFASQGGVIVKASGNAGVRMALPITLRARQLDWVQEYQLGVDLGLIKAVFKDAKNLAPAYIFVGNMRSAKDFDDTSNRAGVLAPRYVCAWGTNVPSTVRDKDRRAQTGTSMAAPMVLGALGLLLEAFPSCSPQTLAQNILDTAVSIGPERNFGHGRLDLTAAFEMSAKSCGLPSPALSLQGTKR